MNSEFWLFGQFNSATLTFGQVQALIPTVTPKTIRNWISSGKFPRPIPGDVFRIQDVARWLDEQKSAA